MTRPRVIHPLMPDEPRLPANVRFVQVPTADQRHRRVRVAATVGIVALLLMTTVHAVADTTMAGSRSYQVDVRLDQPFHDSHRFEETLTVAAPLGARILPRLAFSLTPSAPGVEGAKNPTLSLAIYVDGQLVDTQEFHSDAMTTSGQIGLFECGPKTACAEPPILLGWREVDVRIDARIVNSAQRHSGTVHVEIGPMLVEADRGPWIG